MRSIAFLISPFAITCYLILAVNSTALSAEVDEFIPKAKLGSPSDQGINSIVNKHFKKFIDNHNKKNGKSCDRKTLAKELSYVFNSNMNTIWKELERIGVQDREGKNKTSISFPNKDTITKNGTVYRNMEIFGCCEGAMNVSGIPIGTDKIGHMFGSGGMLWEEEQYLKDQKKSDAEITAQLLKSNRAQEQSMFGIGKYGVKSYGDLAANWKGLEFYRNLLDDHKGKKAYISCVNGQVKQNRDFDIKEYASKAMSEASNCSAFYIPHPDKKLPNQAKVFAQTLKDEYGMTCPMDPQDCDQLKKEFPEQNVQSILISPVCFGKKLEDNSEVAEPWSMWEEAKAGAQGLGVVDDVGDAIRLFWKNKSSVDAVKGEK